MSEPAKPGTTIGRIAALEASTSVTLLGQPNSGPNSVTSVVIVDVVGWGAEECLQSVQLYLGPEELLHLAEIFSHYASPGRTAEQATTVAWRDPAVPAAYAGGATLDEAYRDEKWQDAQS